MNNLSAFMQFAAQQPSFIGREQEILEITKLLETPGCRLLSLVGIGGVGKTRLAIQVASQLTHRYADGVYFIHLQPVSAAEFLPSTIAGVLDFSLAGQDEPAVQLLRHLQNKEILLLLDNFEHLMDGVDLVIELLATAPKLRILVTSREALKLQQEWVWRVQGLALPQESATEQATSFGAVRLFVERARQVNPSFSLTAEVMDVVRICRLVEGMPLALELAASWVSSLTCHAIAAEIEENLDFLTSDLHNVPARHRSMQAVFAQTCQMLSEQQLGVFQQLTVFGGGFAFESAQQIAGASVRTLAQLVDKSLLRKDAAGRYQIHELLRQYAETQLRQAGELASVQARHCAYFARYLRTRNPPMSGGKQVETAQEIAGELENIRVAWQWAVDHNQVQALQEMADILYLFYQFHNLYSEAVTAFEKAAHSLRAIRSTSAQIVLAEILCLLSWMYIRLGRLQDASQTAATSEQLYGQLGIAHPLSSLATDPKIPLATCALIRGDYLQARKLADAAQISNRLHQHRGNLMVSFYILASIGLALGDYDEAQKCADEGYALAQADANEWFAAYCLITKGDVARALGNDEQAAHYYQASFALREKFQDREGMGLACSRLGTIALQRGAYTEAIHCFQSGLAFYQNLGDPGGLASVLSGLGDATFHMGDKRMAARYFRQALDAAAQAGTLSLILSILAATAEMLIQGEYTEDGAEILAFVLQHAGCPQEVKSRIERDLSAYGSRLRAEDLHEARTFQGSSLESVISFLDDKLALAEQLQHSQTASHHPLREPLTARELQVLHLLARGLSNREMAQELVLAVGTVKTHIHRISSKLDARSRTEAVAHARKLHLL